MAESTLISNCPDLDPSLQSACRRRLCGSWFLVFVLGTALCCLCYCNLSQCCCAGVLGPHVVQVSVWTGFSSLQAAWWPAWSWTSCRSLTWTSPWPCSSRRSTRWVFRSDLESVWLSVSVVCGCYCLQVSVHTTDRLKGITTMWNTAALQTSN